MLEQHLNSPVLHYENEFIRIRTVNDILECNYKPNIVVDKSVSSLMIKKRIEFSNHMDRYLLSDCSGVKYWTMSSRNNDMKDEAYKYIKKCALIVDSTMLQTLWKFTTKIFPSPVEIKVFRTAKEGEKWLIKEMGQEINFTK